MARHGIAQVLFTIGQHGCAFLPQPLSTSEGFLQQGIEPCHFPGRGLALPQTLRCQRGHLLLSRFAGLLRRGERMVEACPCLRKRLSPLSPIPRL